MSNGKGSKPRNLGPKFQANYDAINWITPVKKRTKAFIKKHDGLFRRLAKNDVKTETSDQRSVQDRRLQEGQKSLPSLQQDELPSLTS